MRISTLVSLLVMLASTSVVSAQTLYKSVMPDGRVVYGDDPEYDAKRVGTIKPPPAKTGTVLPTSGSRDQSRMIMTRTSTNGGASVAVLGGNGSAGGRRPSVKYCP